MNIYENDGNYEGGERGTTNFHASKQFQVPVVSLSQLLFGNLADILFRITLCSLSSSILPT